MTDVEKIAPAAPKAAKESVKRIAAAAAAAPKPETFEAFSMGQFDATEVFRDLAERSARQARDSYDKMRTLAEEATDVIEDQIEATRSGFVALNAKALDAAKANTDATFQFARDLLGLKTFAEAIELNTAFARQQFELMAAQAKEMQDLVTRVATESTAPMKDAYDKLTRELKVA